MRWRTASWSALAPLGALLVVVAVLFVFVVTRGGSGGSDGAGNGSNPGGASSTVSGRTTTPTPSAAMLLQTGADRVERLRSFHFVLEHENGGTDIVRGIQMTRAEGDIVTPDRMKATVKGSLSRLNLEVDIIVLGPQAWIENPLTGRFEQESLSLADIFDPATGVPALMRSARDARLTGREQVDGAESQRVEASVDSGELKQFVRDAEPGHPVTAVVWTGVQDAQVHRIELRGRIAAGDSDKIVRRLTLSHFDQSVSIDAPR